MVLGSHGPIGAEAGVEAEVRVRGALDRRVSLDRRDSMALVDRRSLRLGRLFAALLVAEREVVVLKMKHGQVIAIGVGVLEVLGRGFDLDYIGAVEVAEDRLRSLLQEGEARVGIARIQPFLNLGGLL